MEQIHVLAWNTIDSYQDRRGFVVQAFGRSMSSGEQIQLEMEGFKPYFRIKINKHTSRAQVDKFFNNFLTFCKGIDPKFIFECRFPLYPYTEFYERFLKFTFNGEFTRKKAAEIIRQWIREKDHRLLPDMQLYDAALPSLLALQHEMNISPSGHIGVRLHSMSIDMDGIWHIPYNEVFRIEDDRLGAFKIASFDIETLSYDSYISNSSVFPDFNKTNDVISQIGTCVMTISTGEIHRYCFVLDSEKSFFKQHEKMIAITDEEHSNFILYPFYSEKDLLLAWSRFIHDVNIDIFIGYNIFGFDWQYIHARCGLHQIEEEFSKFLSRTNRYDRMFQMRQLSSNAYGDNKMWFYDPIGRLNVDVYLHIKKEFKLDSYKLDNTSEHFLNRKKLDMPPQRLFQALKESRESIIEVAKYCVRDCDLVNELMVHLKIFPSIMEMSNISRIPFQYVLLRGQQIRCFSLISFHARELKYSVPDKIELSDKRNEFEGGYVMTPEKKIYMDDPICVLDVMSLHPSLIIAYNLCYSTIVIDKKEPTTGTEVDFHSVNISEGRIHRFVKSNVRTGILSVILQGLWNQRQYIKKQMKSCTTEIYTLLDARQLSIKCCMNSLFGLTGITQDYAMLPCQYIAESITFMGRYTIQFAKTKIEEWYGKNTVKYIDSDSLFICFGEEVRNNLTGAFEKGQEAETRLNEILPSPIKMEFEKILFPFIILTKKRYCGLVFEDSQDLTKSKILYKGISVVRRDFCAYTKKTLEEAMQIVFLERNIDKAYRHVQQSVQNLIEGRVSMESLVMSKTLSSKNIDCNNLSESTLPHVALYAKMKKRDPNNCPKAGERIEFLFTITGAKLLKDKVECPEYVRDNGLHLDLLYYYNHQLHNPINELFSLLLAPEPFDPVGTNKTGIYLLENFERKQHQLMMSEINKREGQREITSFFLKRLKK